MSLLFAILVAIPLIASFASLTAGAPSPVPDLHRRDDKIPWNTTCGIAGPNPRLDMIAHLIAQWSTGSYQSGVIPTTMPGSCTVPYCHCKTQAELCATGGDNINFDRGGFSKLVKESFNDCSGVFDGEIQGIYELSGDVEFRPFERVENTFKITVGVKPDDSDTKCPC